MRIEFNKNNYFKIYNIELCYVYGNKVKRIIMIEDINSWYAEVDLKDGEYLYKFIVNDGLKLNDCNAIQYKKWIADEVWSVMKVKDGEIVVGKHKYIKLRKYSMSPGIRYGSYLSNRIYNHLYSKFSISIELENVEDTHSVTAVWYRENGTIYHIEEKTIDIPEKKYIYGVNVVFWINIPNKINSNNWTIEIYVDGEKHITDYFICEKKGDERYVRFNSFI